MQKIYFTILLSFLGCLNTLNAQCVPSITCPPPLVLACNQPVNGLLILGWLNNASFNACGAPNPFVTTDYNPNLFNTCGGTQNVNFALRDATGLLLATCSANLTINATAPVLLCPPDLNIPECTSMADRMTLVNNYQSQFSFSGGCGTATSSFNNFTVASICAGGTTSITYKVEECGKSYTCTRNIIVAPALPPTLVCPGDLIIPECTSPTQTTALVTAWRNQFSFTGGCGPTSANFNNFIVSDICRGGVMPVIYKVSDDCGSYSCGANIIVTPAAPPTLVCAPDLVIPSCTSPADVAVLVNNWQASFSVTGGCGNVTTSFNNFMIPDICTGGTMPVIFKVDDDCGTYTCGSNIVRLPGNPPVLNCPPDLVLPSCASPADINTLVMNYQNSFTFTGACGNASTSFDNFIPADVCAGGSVPLTFKVTDDCGTYSCTRNVVFPMATPPVLNCPADLMIPSCASPADINTLVMNYQNSFTFTGACGNASTSFDNFVVPDVCTGGTVPITFKVTDNCATYSCTRNIIVPMANPPVLNCPADLDIPPCTTPADLITLVQNYQNQFSFSGACGTSSANFLPFVLPDVCVGGSVAITYKVDDVCGTTRCTRNINVPVPANDLMVNCPADLNIPCTTQADVIGQVQNFVNSFSFSGGCNASATITNYTIPDVCVGGSFDVTYTATGDCNTVSCTRTVTVAPPDPVVVTPPIFPASVSCDEAATYMVSNATYNNNCNLSGVITPSVSRVYDNCNGGTITINYNTTDACGRNVSAGPFFISVDPAPDPTLTVPTFPTTVTCTEAQIFLEEYASYDNGLTGICRISGFIQPVVVKDFDLCNGGTITITYNGRDECGNFYAAGPIYIDVQPAPVPTLTLPEIPYWELTCIEANNLNPGNATYDNGLIGTCRNAGMIYPLVERFYDNCDGGALVISYTGQDECGNPLSSGFIKLTVRPDVTAPYGTCVGIEESFLFLYNVPEPNELGFYKDSIASHFMDDCGVVVVTVVGDTGEPVCGLDGRYNRTYSMEVADECGNVADTCMVSFSGDCSPLYCTLAQTFYADPNDSLFGFSSLEILDSLLDFGNDPIVIGDTTTCGFTLDDPQCVQNILAGTGASVALPENYMLNCGAPLNNVLVNQVITTILNIRYNLLFNPNGPLDFGNYQLDATCQYIPFSIQEVLPPNPTINDFLDYSNDFISCACTGTCGNYELNAEGTFPKVTCVLLGLNSRWHDCDPAGPCYFTFPTAEELLIANGGVPIIDEIKLAPNPNTISLYPNPTTSIINLQMTDGIGTAAVVEIFNAQGSKVGERKINEVPAETTEFDVSDLTPGVYLMSIQLEGRDLVTKKFFIAR